MYIGKRKFRHITISYTTPCTPFWILALYKNKGKGDTLFSFPDNQTNYSVSRNVLHYTYNPTNNQLRNLTFQRTKLSRSLPALH